MIVNCIIEKCFFSIQTFYKPPPSEVGDSVDSGFSSCYTQSVASDIDIVMMSSMHEPATGDAGFDSP